MAGVGQADEQGAANALAAARMLQEGGRAPGAPEAAGVSDGARCAGHGGRAAGRRRKPGRWRGNREHPR
jgi:hypothetical protein